MREKIIEMLGKGIPAAQVASAVGCDDSYISQLLSEQGVEDTVKHLRADHFSAYIELDKKVDDAEEEALQKVASLIPYITRPLEAVRVYDVLNAAKRRAMATIGSGQAVAQTVILDLPEASRVRFTITHDKQVIEVEGRSMTTMPAKSLAIQLEQRNAARLLNAPVPSGLSFNASQKIVEERINSRNPFTASSKADMPLAEQL